MDGEWKEEEEKGGDGKWNGKGKGKKGEKGKEWTGPLLAFTFDRMKNEEMILGEDSIGY